MSETTSRYTPTETAYLLGEPVKVVRKALDDGPIDAEVVKVQGVTVRLLDYYDVLYLGAIKSNPDLSPTGRAKVYHALIDGHLDDHQRVQVGDLSLSLAEQIRELNQRVVSLKSLGESIDQREDGSAFFKGTDIEVHRIAALIDGGMSLEEIMADYPSLQRGAIKAASPYAAAYPKSGRPFPTLTAKRALRNAGLEALGDSIDDDASDVSA